MKCLQNLFRSAFSALNESVTIKLFEYSCYKIAFVTCSIAVSSALYDE